eukprot:TRINITY_DN9898_c0_g1_i1.p1 TRINITY_DN9898_c0_g1~~TRINITY_DN9898_c0_g1_i1.p1  ORF type:complete len:202 (-),score=47.80 TRINITY_DN9898_c0_g1_i1:53-658(-)
MISQFNDVAHWVVVSIVNTKKIKKRIRQLTYFIKICEELLLLQDFHTLNAILGGLSHSAIFRLKYSFAELPKSKDYQDLKNLMSASADFKAYREYLTGLVPPMIPYLGLFLKDLVYIEEANDKIENLINFNKRRLTYRVIDQIKQFQQAPYNLSPVNEIKEKLLEIRIEISKQYGSDFTEDDVFALSKEIEPRNVDRADIL